MIIEELKKYLRATILTGADVARREYALELLEKIISMEIKIEQNNLIVVHPVTEQLDEHQP